VAKRKRQDKRDDVAPPASGGPVRHLLLGLLGLQALALGVKAVDDRFQSDDAARSEQDRTSLIIAERLTQRARLVRNAIEVSARTGASRSLTAEASEDIERILTLADAALSDDPRIIAATETASGLLASGETVGLSKEGDIVVAVSLTGSGDILGIAPATDWLPLPVGDLKYSLIGDTEISLGNQEVTRGAAIDRPGGIITTVLGGRTVSACAPVSGGDLTICTGRPLAWVEARDAGRLAFYLLLLLGPALALFGLDHENRKQQAARREAEKDSETSSRLVDLIMQSAGAGHWEWEEDGKRILISPEFASLLGRSGETSITAPDFLDFVYVADRDSMVAAIRESRATGHIHTIFRARNGHHQQYYLELRGQRVHDGEAGRMRFIGIITDVTQQKLAENKLKASEMRLRNALDGFNQPFALWDQRKRLTNWNDAFVRDFGLGETVRPQMSYDTFEMVKASTIRLERESEGERAREVWLKDGRWLKIVERATPDGGLITMGIDISGNVDVQESLRGQQEKLKRFLRKLEHSEAHAAEMARKYQEEKTRAEQASKSKSAFLANVSHELRTPLNAINGFSEMLISEIFGPLGDPRYKDYASDILTSGQHLLEMINDILDMAKIEAGKMTINTRPIDPVDPVDAAVRMVRHRAEDAGVNLTLEAGDLPMIEADHRAVRQMMLNLLSNAIKFTDAGGRVAVSLTRKEGFVRIAVRDTGVGIPKEALPRLGKPFEQVRETADRNYEGTGLGLALTKSFAEMHGGRMSIASEPGKGTLVAIYLPLARPNAGAADAAATRRPNEAAE
jgi:two-component system, cell cycle sensor histidine kinase PleC